MGSLSHRLFHGGGPRPRSNGSDTGPLRKVIGHCGVGGAIFEALECGHLQMPKSDLMGETNAARRRCKKCRANSLVQFVGTPPTNMTAEEYQKTAFKKA